MRRELKQNNILEIKKRENFKDGMVNGIAKAQQLGSLKVVNMVETG